MGIRLLATFSTAVMAILFSVPAVGQVAGEKKAGTSKAWKAPLASDGHPDLQGTWVNNMATPLERPAQLKDKVTLTDAEVADLKERADRIFKNGKSDFGAGDAVFMAALANVERYANKEATDSSSGMGIWEFDNRTSMITDPADGRLPAYTPEGRKRQAAFGRAALVNFNPAFTEELTPLQRCITWGVPMIRTSSYTRYFQIAQTPGWAVVVMESIHDARIIPLDGRPHLAQNVRTWNGDSVGHWEDDTLVVDTTNFSSKTNFMGAGENLHLVERFSRAAADEIRYEVTVEDPSTWVKPWTALLRLKHTDEKMFEVACHEGNGDTIEVILSAARKREQAAKEAAAKSSK